MSSFPSHLLSKDVTRLALDDATVTLGAQFRTVALGLLITQLSPAASSYAWDFLIGSIPGILLAGWYGEISVRFPARRIMLVSYLGRFVLVLGLWRIQNFAAAIALLAGISIGAGSYSSAQAHYVGQSGNLKGTQQIVARLRQAESLIRLAGPFIAGLVLSKLGFRWGFLFSGICYLIAWIWVAGLSPRKAPMVAEPSPGAYLSRFKPDLGSLIIFCLSLLVWQGNTLAIAYTFHVLHRHSFGYGITLSVWGGAGLVAGHLLPRLRASSLPIWTIALFGALAVIWTWLGFGVGFWIFVVLGGCEGFCWWLLQDLLLADLLSRAAPGTAGRQRARFGAFDDMGSLAGTILILVIPARFLILPLYRGLAIGALVVAAGLIVWHRVTSKG